MHTLLLAGLTACVNPASPPDRSFALGPEGSLLLPLPAAWSMERDEDPEAILTILFTAPSGEQLVVRAFRNPTDDPEFNTASKVWPAVERAGKTQLDSAVETRIQLVELRGTSQVGYYFTLTDRTLVGKTAPPGEYRAMTRGGLGVGDLLLLFTVLSQDSDAPAVHEALDALAAATVGPE